MMASFSMNCLSSSAYLAFMREFSDSMSVLSCVLSKWSQSLASPSCTPRVLSLLICSSRMLVASRSAVIWWVSSSSSCLSLRLSALIAFCLCRASFSPKLSPATCFHCCSSSSSRLAPASSSSSSRAVTFCMSSSVWVRTSSFFRCSISFFSSVAMPSSRFMACALRSANTMFTTSRSSSAVSRSDCTAASWSAWRLICSLRISMSFSFSPITVVSLSSLFWISKAASFFLPSATAVSRAVRWLFHSVRFFSNSIDRSSLFLNSCSYRRCSSSSSTTFTCSSSSFSSRSAWYLLHRACSSSFWFATVMSSSITWLVRLSSAVSCCLSSSTCWCSASMVDSLSIFPPVRSRSVPSTWSSCLRVSS
mmetsp:Transcript_6441/g.15172  ORF Transcript_6441/g.15172 Transcript_6441/m.15172 type:complete len:364 (+) Transcript_6441:1136-2227(+)